ncbi:MAG: peptidase M1 [Proteobacteria bacterium SG_bin5]|nr:MAG: peptidase M1 [Proteobacteria bacterium SG_bin5]
MNDKALVAAVTLLAGCASAARGEGAPQKGLPPITAQTARSGGPVDPLQAALAFDAVDLRIELLPDRQAITGVATLSFTARAPLDTLLLDLDRNLAVRAVSIDGTALKPAAWSNPDGRLRIALPHPVPAGARIVARIGYGGTPHVAVNAPWDDGFVWTKTRDGKPWIASTQEGYGCDLFWPCLDFPTGEPGVADLRITVPRGLSAPANGVLVARETLPRGRTSWHWRVKHPNTYALALTVGPYELLSDTYHSRFGNLIRLNYWYLPPARQKASALFAEFAPTLDFFEQVIGPYPFGDEKLGVVESPYLGMEHQTINAYGNNYKKSPEGFDWLFQHELSHEWFGNQLTAGDWDDYWLHEGFAQYLQPLYGEWREGKARYLAMLDGYRNRIENRSPLVSGRPRTEEEVYESAQGGPGVDIYYKGAWVLHTLRGLIGDKAFFASVRRLVYGRPDPAPGNFAPRYGSTAEFEALAAVESGQDLGWFFDAYVRRAALPELVATPEPGGLRLDWRAGGRFPMPVEAEVGGTRVTVAMPEGVGHLPVPAGTHVVLDPEAKILKRSVAIEAYQADQRGG